MTFNTHGELATSPKTSGSHRGFLFSLWCIVAAFGTYFCMYGFRKPYTVAEFSDLAWLGIGYKTLLVTSQVLGYTLSKFIGIKFIAEAKPGKRALWILLLIGMAQLALLGFAVVPAPWNISMLFLNGLPLGMVFGLVLGFLEGRILTEFLIAGLCASFILADGVVKSVGAVFLERGVTEFWMPFCSGLVFLAPLFGFVWMLNRIPTPNEHDKNARTERAPMNREERSYFFKKYAPGLVLLLLGYLAITILRSIRADFAPEIWKGLGVKTTPALFSQTEFYVAILIILSSGAFVLIKNNPKAFFTAILFSMGGCVLVGFSISGLQNQTISPVWFMTFIGLGLYIPYVAIHTTIFERMLAVTKERGNIGYLMYLADAIGYLGYCVVMLYKNLAPKDMDFIQFFSVTSWIVAIFAGCCFAFAGWFFTLKHKINSPGILPETDEEEKA